MWVLGECGVEESLGEGVVEVAYLGVGEVKIVQGSDGYVDHPAVYLAQSGQHFLGSRRRLPGGVRCQQVLFLTNAIER